MDDLISRTAALDAIDGMKPIQNNTDQLIMHALCWAAVKSIPITVDAVPVMHGRWTHYLCVGHDRYKCSECSHWIGAGIDRNYCPNCGAKMESEHDMSKSNETTIGHWLDGSDDLPPIGGFHE